MSENKQKNNSKTENRKPFKINGVKSVLSGKLKTKKGRPKNIKSPEEMWSHFEAYKEKTKAKPIKVKDWVGKDAYEVQREKERPLTMEGFENYCYDEGIITDTSDYFENKENRYSDFVPVCSRIKKAIRQDQIEGGMSGIYNPSITQRLNGLVDRSETVIKEQPLFPDIE